MSAAVTAQPAMTLRRRLSGLFASAGLVLGLVVLLTATVFVRTLDLQGAVTEEYFDAVTETDRAFVSLVDAETGLRGYALTGDPVTLEPYERSLESDSDFGATALAVAEISGDDGIVDAYEVAVAAAGAWYSEYAEPLIAQIEAEGPASVTPAQIEAGRVYFDEVRAGVGGYLDRLRGVRADAVSELERLTNLSAALITTVVLTSVVVSVLIWVALRRWVVTPVDALAADARAVAEGDLEHHVASDGPGEIEALAHDVEQMRVALVAQLAELRRSRTEIADAHDRLTEQAEELRRSNRDLEQFAYVASHDLQEPLRKVASFTQLLQKRYGGQLDERADQYIEFAVDGAKRMQRLIQDLLGFSRVGRLGGEVVDVDLGKALERAVDQLDERIEDAGAVVTHDDLPVVRGEEPLLVQLFQNLVGNAVKFRHPDRVPSVHVSARRVEDSWEIECRDNGIGIDPQYAERVFVIFQRLHAKDVYEGTGIGLALCKKIVEFHGGRIWIPETAGEGTTIRLTLPAAAGADTP
ncbi:sensor histidine kinase [Cellulomonas shaoxiangyii]|uniref:histidine kinase n=1 Tax=Cellulomonas shaoxiangyii TaxID=2566013 RepID=A0A4P7SL54_9CELL|nr:sensor histidine kinase [Cellulomonas shaoxiangyii]QCB93906.1 HAMP domain-containing protein [Cellulomonas shaoxiangyii]TGY85979.1 HAMP domain-containing protein [Cellulomonas shaoxiangyii]